MRQLFNGFRFVAAGCVAVTMMGAAPIAANEQVDPTTTGSIADNPTAGPAEGSSQFRNALDMLAQGHRADAYRLARGFPDPVERRTVQWAAVYFGGGDVDYDSVRRFAQDAPHFATASLYKTRLEQALVDADPEHREAISLLGGQMPNTIEAQILLARSYVRDGQVERAAGIARDIWVTNFLSRDQEDMVRSRLGNLLTPADHWKRAVHLLMHDRIRGANRMSEHFNAAQQSLIDARAAVARRESNAQTMIDRVAPGYRDHPVFHFTRGQFARRSGNFAGAVELLNMAKGDLPDAAEWWYERRYIARELLERGDARSAYSAVAPYQHGPEGRVVDAYFHAGWIALEFLGDAQSAANHFEKMKSLSTIGSSISQSNYWLGRAYDALGDDQRADAAYRQAAAHHTYYYGLLSRYRLGQEDVPIRPLPAADSMVPRFEARELVKAVRLLGANDRQRLAEPLITRLIYDVEEPAEMLLTARLAQDVGAHQLAILMADVANGKGVALDLFNYPRDGIPNGVKLAEIDLAAVYAVARQESHFDIDAVSHAGARGIMQLMPATAKETAGRLGVGYSPSRLVSDAGYNALLGSTYLDIQVGRYDGSLVLGAAAYNAGAGNVNKWIEAFGNPMDGNVDPVVWIEQIPFTETRNYVQRVVANYMFYKARLGGEQLTVAEVLRRIG